MSVLMERDAAALEKESLTRLICVGAGLLYLGRQVRECHATLDCPDPPFRT